MGIAKLRNKRSFFDYSGWPSLKYEKKTFLSHERKVSFMKEGFFCERNNYVTLGHTGTVSELYGKKIRLLE